MLKSSSRFKINPVELSVFLAVMGGFILSANQLVQNTSTEEGLRSIASVTEGKMDTFSMDCKKELARTTQAPMVRILGEVCSEKTTHVTAKITNQSNHFSASLLPDASTRKFESELIPLEIGHNPIRFEFTSADGKTLSKVVDIERESL